MAGYIWDVLRAGELLLPVRVITVAGCVRSGAFSLRKGTSSEEQHSYLHLEEPGIPLTWANCGPRPFLGYPAMGTLTWLHHFVRMLRWSRGGSSSGSSS